MIIVRRSPCLPTRFAPALVIALLLATGPPLRAQTAADEQAVLEVVVRLFDALRTADGAKARSVFHPDARLVSVGSREGRPVARISTIDGFIEAIGGATEEWDERIYEPEVRVDGDLATVWTFYTFAAGGRFSHCGVDAFQLARTAEGWKILQIADTRRRDGCKPPADR